jgi:hypothetical protein
MPKALGKTSDQSLFNSATTDLLEICTYTDAAKRKPHDETYILRYSGQFIGLSGSLGDREWDRTSLAIGACAR